MQNNSHALGPNGQIVGINQFAVFDDPNSYDPDDATWPDAICRADTKFMDPNKEWAIYKNARAFSASQNVGWEATANY